MTIAQVCRMIKHYGHVQWDELERVCRQNDSQIGEHLELRSSGPPSSVTEVERLSVRGHRPVFG